MSATLSLYEGILLVFAFVITYLSIREANRIKKTVEEVRITNDISRKRMELILNEISDKLAIYSPSLDQWKEQIDKNLEVPISEHLFHAFFNTLVSLGASDMGKEGTAKQNMAINGFQKIGRAIGKGLKKEIPAIEKFSGGGSSGGGIPGIEGIIGNLFGIDLPPGTLNAIQGMGGSKPPPEKDKGGW